MFALGTVSKSKLEGVHPNLIKIVERAIQLSKYDFKVVEGVRSDKQCWINYGKGRTAAQCIVKGVPANYALPAAGKVTWLNDPLNSKHRKQHDGFGHAVDLLPEPYDWKDLSHFDAVAQAMITASEELKVPIRWGADWDHDGKPREKGETDSPHFELV